MESPEDSSPSKPNAELPSYLLEDEHEPSGWKRWLRGWRLVAALGILILAAGALAGAKPAYRELKARRALDIAAQAEEAFDRGEGGHASSLLRQAALMASQDERVASRVRCLSARAGDMTSLEEIGKRVDGGKACVEETLVFGERSLALGNTDRAAAAASALPSGLRGTEAVRRTVLQAGILQARGQTDEAQRVLREALATSPPGGESGLRLALAKVLLGEDGSRRRGEAEQLLQLVALDQSVHGVSALRLLALSHAGGSPDERRSLDQTLELLRQHPSSLPSDELFIARLIASSDPSRMDEAVGSLVTRLGGPDAKLEDRLAAGRWLIGIQVYEPVLDLLGADEPARHLSALLLRFEALSGLGRWHDCEAMLETGWGETLSDTLYFLLRARLADLRGEQDKEVIERRQLRQALKFSALPHVLFAARQAEAFGWKPEAFAAWRVLAVDGDLRVEALRGQLRTMPPDSSADEAAEVAAALHSLDPDDPTARFTATYYQLLAGRNAETGAAVAHQLLQSEPGSRNARRIAALAFLRAGEADKGLEVFPGDDGEDRWRALHAALLSAAGRSAESKEVARAINLENLDEGEKELLRGLAP